MVEKTPHDGSPFVPALEPNIFNDPVRNRAERLQGVKGRDDVLVRVERIRPKSINDEDELRNIRDAYHNNPNDLAGKERALYQKKLDEYYSLDEAKTYREHLLLLNNKYGIKNSGYSPVIGANPKDDMDPARRYIVTNMITGISAEEVGSNIPLLAEKVLFEKILQYYHDIYVSGGIYLEDLDIGQFIYSPDQDEMILVDVETEHIDEASPLDRNKLISFKRRLGYFIDAMQQDHPDEFSYQDAQALKARIEQEFKPS